MTASQNRGSVRSSLALIAALGVAVALSACSTGPAPEAGPGASTEAVTVTGEFGSEPKVTFPTPLTPTETQCEVLHEGEGDSIAEGQLVEVAFVAYDGGTGEKLGGGGFGDAGGQLMTRGGSDSVPAFDKGLSCASEGSRVMFVAADYDASGAGEPTPGADPKNGVVFVLDVLRAFPMKAEGAPQLTRDGFPAVVLAPDGRPGITVPKSDPPADAKQTTAVETLKGGNGPVVKDGDTVVVQFTAVNWDDNQVIEELSTWDQGTPARVGATSDAATAMQIGLPVGFTKSLIGQQVGSQLGLIIPASEAYGEQGAGNGVIAPNATLFFVVDILGVL
ncbi:FKBP-type peptidyl-prolyl cis-trans isomerase [Agromyces soli]|uniref:peptidylprolyl isomerase n=1 Tax=Agromyces soli TaxID=659012 RepID=A0ABY4AQN2_9MICO|nr:FKBP-type peptidyl-prolyl cis-trans isomerase [Agromyces soli]UOE25481.1 FKBP-type peptidyl-prolyl cis-trans isomerase [Agromyces soli]